MPAENLTIFISHPSHFLTDNKPHGDGLIAYGFLKRLADMGVTLHVAVPLSDLQHALPPNIHLHPIRTWSKALPGVQSPAYRIEYAVRVRLLYKRLQQLIPFDAIHQLNPGVLGLSLLLYGLGPPLIIGPVTPAWDTSGSDLEISFRARIKQHLKRFVYRIVFRRCDAVLTPTEMSARLLAEASLPSSLAVPFPFGVDTEELVPGASPQQPTILFLANLTRRKGIYVLLEAFEKLWLRMPSARLIIGGGGEEQAQVAEHVLRMRSAGNIQLLGNVPRAHLLQTMQDCTVYCLPSLSEPFGMSALEAMACGKALVVSDVGGLANLVRPEGGLKVPAGNSDALAAALQEILSQPELAARMGEFNRQLAVEQYRWGTLCERLILLYTGLKRK